MRNQRQDEIMKILTENRMVKACDLVRKFGVSMETIRRDLKYLEKEGYLTRAYGGAVAKSMHGLEPEYTFREIKNYEKKIAIGREAAQLVEDGDTIIIDLGTTTLEFAKFLRTCKKLTVFTNSIQIAWELTKNAGIRVILLGGDVRPGELSTSGFLAEDSIDRFHVDKVFLGVGGFTIGYGIGDYHMEETNLRRHYVEHAQKVIALADYSKFGVKTLNHVCDIKNIDILVTDQEADKKLIAELRRRGVQVIAAHVSVSDMS
ncbi:MAG: DeoR/GlpR family DNA-binding transcription regulator [Lachnospiraceae bacterium]